MNIFANTYNIKQYNFEHHQSYLLIFKRRMLTRQQSAGTPMSAWNSRKGSRYNSLTEIDSKDIIIPGTPSFIHSATPARERRKFVSFTVELLREGGPLGNIQNYHS